MTSGVVVWITGRPSSGKSTFARAAQARLRERGTSAVVLDGDDVRDALVPRPGYDEAERDRFYDSLARLAALLANQGLVVLVAATANRRTYRERARGIAPKFVEVYLHVPPEECAKRDAKGLYAQARAGNAPALPGAGVPYEEPEAPDVIARGGTDEDAVLRLLDLIAR